MFVFLLESPHRGDSSEHKHDKQRKRAICVRAIEVPL